MSLPRLDHTTHIADQLNVLAAIVKVRSRAGLTDANHILETISARFFNTLFDWNLVNLNAELANYPAADLGDRQRRIAIQVTNADGSDKIEHTWSKAVGHGLGIDFDLLIIFFLLPKKPGLPRNFSQPPAGPKIETWDITDLLKKSQELPDLDVLARAAKVLDEELGKIAPADWEPKFDISRIVKYAPAELIGREDETKLLNDAWEKVVCIGKGRPHVLTFVAFGGEGKTSLVAKWAAELAHQDWPGCDAAFAWSFYSQGTREQVAASSDLFLKEALTFFGDDADKEFAASPAGAFEKGQRLARIVGQRRSMLILDGLEPLQYPTEAKAFKPGELKDQGVAKLLKDLASGGHGLCIVTTRIEVPDLQVFKGGAVIETHLKRLPRSAGVTLLKSLGVKGSERRTLPLKDGDEKSEKVNEFEKLVEDVKGHALTLTLLGGFMKRAFHGDIRQRDRVRFEKADEKMDGGHAFRTMAAYEEWLLGDGGDEGRREVALLRLIGLFDRPADGGCLAALRSETIPDLTEPLAGLAEEDWEYCLSGLESAKLLTVNREASGALVSLDAHPHLREYFSRQLRTQQPDAWRAAHRRLYEHLCATTREGDQPTLEDLQPLYQAVAHGCQAGLQEEAYETVYRDRINKGPNVFYSLHKLGAFGSGLGAVATFFDRPWRQLAVSLTPQAKASLLAIASFQLRALGRLAESTEPTRATLDLCVSLQAWDSAAKAAGNLSELDLTMGEVVGAVRDAEHAVAHADRRGNVYEQYSKRTTHADALHQAGRRAEAETRLREAEQMQAERYPYQPLLYSSGGFRYCELLLAASECAAWQIILQGAAFTPLQRPNEGAVSDDITCENGMNAALLDSCLAVSRRATQTLKIAETNNSLLDIARDHLTLGRTALYAAILERSAVFTLRQRPNESAAPNDGKRRNDLKVALQSARRELDVAVAAFRRAGTQHLIPHGLLTRAWCSVAEASAHTLGGDAQEAARLFSRAQEDLDEAWEIAERGPMKLFMADIHLYRARLFGRPNDEGRMTKYPWESPAADLAAAEKLINDCGYHRRDQELADAKAVILAT